MSAYLEKQKLLDWLFGEDVNLEKQGDDTDNMMNAGMYYSKANQCRNITETIISGRFDWQPNRSEERRVGKEC